KVDRQEVDNALRQAQKELGTRYDFRGTGAEVAWAGEEAVTVRAETEERAKAALDVFKEKLVKRGISLKALDAGEPKPSGKTHKTDCRSMQGVSLAEGKAISQEIRDQGANGGQVAIQGDQSRVTGKKKDVLQAAIATHSAEDLGVALQFTNYR